MLFGFGLLLTFSSFAQQSDQRAEKLLNQVYQKAQSYDNMAIKFNYILKEGNSQLKQETNGNVTLKGDKYKLNLRGTTRIFDGQKLYDIIPEDKEIIISKYDPEKKGSTSPSKLLSFYRKGYQYKWDITQNDRGRKIQYVKLIPTDKNAEVDHILLGIDAQTKHIAKMIKILDDNSQVIIEVKSFKTNLPLPENLFQFNKDKYQGFYINRLF